MVEAHLYQSLSTAGFQVRTITFSLLYPSLLFPGKTQFDTSENTFFRHDDKIERVINSINPRTWLVAARKIRQIEPDLVIFVWWMPFFAPAYYSIARLIKRNPKIKIAFLVENYISHEKRWFEKLINTKTLDIADAFICQSGFIENKIKTFHQKQPVYRITLSIYDCYDFGKYDQQTAKSLLKINHKNVILFFGLIRKYKGLDKLLKAKKIINQYLPDSYLLAVGECYEELGYYEGIIKEENIAGESRLINQFVENEEIEPYFKAADVVVLPYNTASQSGILMMAYGFKKPVVVNNVGGLPELVNEGRTGFVIPDNSPERIAEGVVKALTHPERDQFAHHIANLNQSLGYQSLHQIVHEITSIHA